MRTINSPRRLNKSRRRLKTICVDDEDVSSSSSSFSIGSFNKQACKDKIRARMSQHRNESKGGKPAMEHPRISQLRRVPQQTSRSMNATAQQERQSLEVKKLEQRLVEIQEMKQNELKNIEEAKQKEIEKIDGGKAKAVQSKQSRQELADALIDALKKSNKELQLKNENIRRQCKKLERENVKLAQILAAKKLEISNVQREIREREEENKLHLEAIRELKGGVQIIKNSIQASALHRKYEKSVGKLVRRAVLNMLNEIKKRDGNNNPNLLASVEVTLPQSIESGKRTIGVRGG